MRIVMQLAEMLGRFLGYTVIGLFALILFASIWELLTTLLAGRLRR